MSSRRETEQISAERRPDFLPSSQLRGEEPHKLLRYQSQKT